MPQRCSALHVPAPLLHPAHQQAPPTVSCARPLQPWHRQAKPPASRRLSSRCRPPQGAPPAAAAGALGRLGPSPAVARRRASLLLQRRLGVAAELSRRPPPAACPNRPPIPCFGPVSSRPGPHHLQWHYILLFLPLSRFNSPYSHDLQRGLHPQRLRGEAGDRHAAGDRACQALHRGGSARPACLHARMNAAGRGERTPCTPAGACLHAGSPAVPATLACLGPSGRALDSLCRDARRRTRSLLTRARPSPVQLPRMEILAARQARWAAYEDRNRLIRCGVGLESRLSSVVRWGVDSVGQPAAKEADLETGCLPASFAPQRPLAHAPPPGLLAATLRRRTRPAGLCGRGRRRSARCLPTSFCSTTRWAGEEGGLPRCRTFASFGPPLLRWKKGPALEAFAGQAMPPLPVRV